ncbi:hypothetical protein G7069_02860 [Lysobacter sp. HDW10]|jgi:hypothetical protein|nr:hypothetical protein [Lysobacter sp. HDW10]QIK80630.1 hypothetical protein G7069_02860 [Lysobacter sp. HDW10]
MDDRADNKTVAAGRKRARRTALWFGLIAVAIYAAFILSGVIGRGH